MTEQEADMIIAKAAILGARAQKTFVPRVMAYPIYRLGALRLRKTRHVHHKHKGAYMVEVNGTHYSRVYKVARLLERYIKENPQVIE